MLCRTRKDSNHLFDCFLEIVRPRAWDTTNNSKLSSTTNNDDDTPWILQAYPTDYLDKGDDKLKDVPKFVYPCHGLEVATVQNFSFVMTDSLAKWTYGFCRLAPHSETALVLLSAFPWDKTFYKILNL